MKEKIGIIRETSCPLMKEPGEDAYVNYSEMTDEVFSGWIVRFRNKPDENGWVNVETHYGYAGYLHESQVDLISDEMLYEYQEKKHVARIDAAAVDLLETPDIKGGFLQLLVRGSFVILLKKDAGDGFSKVRVGDGTEGYVRTAFLKYRKTGEEFFIRTDVREKGRHSYFMTQPFMRTPHSDAEILQIRKKIVESASAYLKTQYRWGGKSTQGIDCSGLVFMCYQENGILVYRDSKMPSQYPLHKIDAADVQKGDVLYFKDHVAIYIGDGRYIHSTSYAKTPYVTVNSLKPEDPLYRADLAESLICAGTVF